MAMQLITIDDYEKEAKKILPKPTFDYFYGGSGKSLSLKWNQSIFDQIITIPKFLKSSSPPDLSVIFDGQSIAMPLLLSPTAFHGLANEEAEIATIAGANDAGIPMIASTMSNASLEEIQSASTLPTWFQLYVYKDRHITKDLIQRAETAGYTAIVVTVDVPIMVKREHDIRNGFTLPDNLVAKNFISHQVSQFKSTPNDSAVINYTNALFESALDWDLINWITSITNLPIYLKGILHHEEVETAISHGIKGIILSNHGGRQIDTLPSPISVLPKVSKIAAGKINIIVDGGIRRGMDVLKALVLGADMVAIGRPALWGLAVNGKEGVKNIIQILYEELYQAMLLTKMSTIEETKENKLEVLFSNNMIN